jgi:DNA-binding GntR family transcriptional regulator
MAVQQSGKSSKKKIKQPLSEQAYHELKRRILLNEMPVGRPFLEQELSEMLKMSRTPTREAMNRLATEGLVEIRPRHGMFVNHISVDDMREIYAILTGLESTAAGLAAARAPSKEELKTIRLSVDDMEKALKIEDLLAWAKADELFHRSLVELSQNKRLEELVQIYIDQSQRVRMLTLRMRPIPDASNKDHRDVLEAIANGDANLARRTHREHREKAGVMLVDLLESQGLNQI